VTAAVVALGARAAGTLDRVELDMLDIRYDLARDYDESRTNDYAIVAIDQQTFEELGPPRYSRDLHARVLTNLARAGAKAIVFDIEVSGEDSGAPGADRRLVETIAAIPAIVPMVSEFYGTGEPAFLGGPAALRRVRDRVGAAVLETDEDGVARRLTYAYEGVQTLSVVAAERASGQAIERDDLPADPFLVDFRVDPQEMPQRAFSDVAQNEVAPGEYVGKIVVVGPTAAALQDLHQTPRGVLAGPEIIVNGADTALRGFPLREVPASVDVLLVLLLACAVPVLTLWFGGLKSLGVGVAAAALFAIGAVLAFHAGEVVEVVYPLLSAAIATGGSLATELFVVRRQREQAYSQLERIVPRTVAERLVDADRSDVRLPPARQRATILFCDLRRFTAFVERLERLESGGLELREVLDHYLTLMSEAIRAEEGAILAFMGDGIMAAFGVPEEQSDHADRAYRCARRMAGPAMNDLNRWLVSRGAEELELGVGLASGEVHAVMVGPPWRIDYSAIGDTTNVAAKLQARARDDHALLVADATRELLSDAAGLEDLGDWELGGRVELVRVWGLRS
jgi:adenylate cyclase